MRHILLIADPSAGGGGGAGTTSPATGGAAAPAAPAAPAKEAAPTEQAPAGEPAPEGGTDDVWDAMDRRITERRTKVEEPAKAAKAAQEPAKAGEKAGEKVAKSVEEPAKAETPAKPLGDAEIDKMAPKPLRDALKRAHADVKARDGQLASAQAKIKELEGRSQESPALTNRIKDLEKQLQERTQELSAIKQEASPEFRERYDKPFDQAAAYAKSQIEGLPVTDDAGQQRTATWDDFVAIYRMPTAKAIQAATDAFGPAAQFVLGQVDKLKQLQFTRDQAFEEEKGLWKKRADEQTANHAKMREEIQQSWVSTNKAIAEKNPELFGEKADDPEGNDLLKLAFSKIDEALNQMGTMTPQQRVTLHAQLRNRAAAVPRLQLWLDKANARIKELEAENSALKESDPNRPARRAGGEAPGESEDWRSELRTSMA